MVATLQRSVMIGVHELGADLKKSGLFGRGYAVIYDLYAYFAGFIADSAGRYGPAFFTAGGIMVFGSTIVVLKKFIGAKARNTVAPQRQNTVETPGEFQRSGAPGDLGTTEHPKHSRNLSTPEHSEHREHRNTQEQQNTETPGTP